MRWPFRLLIFGLICAGVLTISQFAGYPPGRVSYDRSISMQPDRLPVPTGPRPAVAGPRDDTQAIADALGAHGNRQNIVPSFFTDLIRTMERSGLSGDVAREVALALAGNPKLDEVAALTIAGCLPAYLAATADGVDTALADLTAYIQHPNEHASRAEARFQLLGRDMLTRIEDKLRGGNPAAAELIMEHALLARFNPKLGAKILVPQ